MKKLLIAAAIVSVSLISQAAAFNWTTGSSKAYGVDPTAVTGNGNYGVSATKGDRLDKQTSAFQYVLTLYTADTTTVVGSASGNLSYNLGAISTMGIEIAEAAQGTKYDYTLVISGVQNTLTSKTSADYDYSNASISTTFDGTITTAPNGATALSNLPTTWMVTGVQAVPEPTSGLLLLLGMAGLALRRRRA